MSESPIAEALRVLREKGVIDRSAETNLIESHAWLVSVGELPELVRGELRQKLVAAPDTTGSNVAGISARQTPEFVPESPEEIETLADEHVSDDEPTVVGTKKRGKKSS